MLTIRVIIIMILALIVLIVLAVAFRTQISSLFSSFTHLISGTTESAKDLNIESLVG